MTATATQGLRNLLIKKLSLAGLVISLLAGAVSYYVETWQVKVAAFSLAVASARHFDAPETRRHLTKYRGQEREGLDGLLTASSFVAIRILDPMGGVTREAWRLASPKLRSAVAAHRHEFPAPGGDHSNWISGDDEEFIQVVLPLGEAGAKPVAYFEGIYRIDARMRQEQKDRIRNSGLIALISAFIASLLLYPVLLGLTRQSVSLSSSLLESNIELIQTLGSAIAKRDSDTDSHNYRVTLYAVRLAKFMRRSESEVGDLITGAFLHDVGKIGIPDQILLKPGKLTPGEFAVMKQHVNIGQEITANNRWLRDAGTVISHHHEKFDGSGYPAGLRGDAIPYDARLFAVVDVFDALTSERPYKRAMPLPDALAIIAEGSGTHFDPDICGIFLSKAEFLFAEIGCATHGQLQAKLAEVVRAHFGNQSCALLPGVRSHRLGPTALRLGGTMASPECQPSMSGEFAPTRLR